VQWLADLRQYAPAGSAGNTYAEMISGWYAGKTLANGGSNGWALGLYNGFAEKKTEEQCEGLLINFPQLPGEVSQVAMGPNSAVVFLAAKDKPLAVELAKVLTGDVVQTMKSATGGRKPTRLGIPAPTLIKPENMPEYLVMQNAIETGGLFDLGMGNEHYGEIRAMWAVTLQSIFADRATVPEALEAFQNDANAILAY